MSELHDCPFCGASPNDAVRGPYVHATGKSFIICCGKCGASSDYYSRTGTAIAAWNRRPTPEPQGEAVAWMCEWTDEDDGETVRVTFEFKHFAERHQRTKPAEDSP